MGIDRRPKVIVDTGKITRGYRLENGYMNRTGYRLESYKFILISFLYL